MRRLWPALLILTIVAVAVPAMAQTAAPAGGDFNISWSALDPGNDWAAQIIRNVFPISGTGGVSTTQTTVITQMIGRFTGYIAAVAMFFLCYSTIMQIFRGAETGRLLSNAMSAMVVVRLAFASIMMFPIPTIGFSVGQAAVVQISLWGVGMAKAIYTDTVQAIGPDAMAIAEPVIPGTEGIVLGLIKNELCRSLVNVASNTLRAPMQLVPEPTPVNIGAVGGNDAMTVLSYSMSLGNIGISPACGMVSISAPTQGQTNLAGIEVNQSAIQKQALTSVLANDIAGPVETVARKLYDTRQASALTGLMGILTNATADYNAQLTAAAQAITQRLNASLNGKNAPALADSGANQTQLQALGWAGAGAYYLEFAHLNGTMLSLLSGVPQITAPSYDGFGPSLSSDLAPWVQASQTYMTTLTAYVTTQDGLSVPSGQADLFAGATPGESGSGVIGQIFRRLHLSDRVLQTLTNAIAPTGNNWADPFSALMALGNTMVTIAISALGLAAIASSGTTTAAAAAFQVLTFNFTGAGLTLGLHALMGFLGTPIFALLLGLLIPGLTIAFVLPMIPWVMWMAGVAGWLILVCEAVIAVPLWMLAHMTMEGEGLHGKANEGYALLFNVLFRPTLMLFGLFLGYFVFASISWLIRQTFGIAAGFVLERGWLVNNVLGIIVLLSIFVMTHVVAAMTSFRMISLVPHHVPRLLGFDGAGRVDMDQFTRDAAIVGVGGTLGTIDRGLRDAKLSKPNEQASAGSAGMIAAPDSPSRNSGTSGMDTTLRLTTEVGRPVEEGPEDE